MESYKQLFHNNPYQDPKTKLPIKIGDAKYLKLVEKYGTPKIKSPKSGYKIAIGKGEYNKLIKEGYDLTVKKVKSPKTQKLLTVGGKQYNQLYKEGYYQQLSGNADTDRLILLELKAKELKQPMNKYINSLLTENFWCLWLNKHYHIMVKNCKYIAMHIDEDLDVDLNFTIALKKNYLPVVQFYLENDMINNYSLSPIFMASKNGNLEIVKYLLTYETIVENKDELNDSLLKAIRRNDVNIVNVLIQYLDEDYLSEALEPAIKNENVEIIKLLVEAGADPAAGLLRAVFEDNMIIFKLLLSYDLKIKEDLIITLLAYRAYDYLKIIMLDERNPFVEKLKYQYHLFYSNVINALDQRDYDELDNLFQPYLTASFYELRHRYGRILK